MSLDKVPVGELSKFKRWSDAFKSHKPFDPTRDINDVIRFYRRPIEDWRATQRQNWQSTPGYRKNPKDNRDKGEQIIEKCLLRNPGEPIQIINETNGKSLSLFCTEHNFPLARVMSGQVLCDVFGYLKSRDGYRPVAIEVKEKDGNPWFAVVENLIQVRLARSNVGNVEEWMRKRLQKNVRIRGTCGLVVAPPKYFTGHKRELKAATMLIERLRTETKARIMVCAFDSGDNVLRWIEGSHWPRE